MVKENNWNVIASFEEQCSGRKLNREVLERAIQFAKNNDALFVAYRIDRITRQTGILHMLKSDGFLSRIRTVQTGPDPIPPIVFNLFCSLGEFESDSISSRVKMAARWHRENNTDSWKRWGKGNTDRARKLGLRTRKSKAAAHNEKIQNLVAELRILGYTTLRS